MFDVVPDNLNDPRSYQCLTKSLEIAFHNYVDINMIFAAIFKLTTRILVEVRFWVLYAFVIFLFAVSKHGSNSFFPMEI